MLQNTEKNNNQETKQKDHNNILLETVDNPLEFQTVSKKLRRSPAKVLEEPWKISWKRSKEFLKSWRSIRKPPARIATVLPPFPFRLLIIYDSIQEPQNIIK